MSNDKTIGPFPLVRVEWLDSFGVGSSWTKFTEIDKQVELRCTSVGYIVKETDQYIIVVPHIHGDLSVIIEQREIGASGCGDMAIPKRAIVRQISLTEETS